VADVADGVPREDVELFSLDRPALKAGRASPTTPISR